MEFEHFPPPQFQLYHPSSPSRQTNAQPLSKEGEALAATMPAPARHSGRSFSLPTRLRLPRSSEATPKNKRNDRRTTKPSAEPPEPHVAIATDLISPAGASKLLPCPRSQHAAHAVCSRPYPPPARTLRFATADLPRSCEQHHRTRTTP